MSKGGLVETSRPKALVNDTGSYNTVVPPTYAEYDVAQVINIKSVPDYPVRGDGVGDDTVGIQAIINLASEEGKVVFFPHGIYLVSDTIIVPPNSRLVGEAWTQISATGSKFSDAKRPTPMVKIGQEGDVGVAQLSDFIFTVAETLPGAVLLQVNMAGSAPGDVGVFNTHFRIGGAFGTKTKTECSNPANCLAARLSLHTTSGASLYLENSWSWTADHDLDGSNTVYPGTGAGYLIESRGGTWILGAGVGELLLDKFVLSKID